MTFKIGSLFDGSGGFPLAAYLCGGVPVWASEVEPYPIAVTRSRIPTMKHLGDISKINGAEIEPVDIITFGSPCQDLSVAGKRAGLKHEANGDEETTRSGLFMEAVRIIKEMRIATNGMYPTFALWENVPGAFSSNKGQDFRIVLEELIKVAEPQAPSLPMPEKNGWAYADCIMGDGWSVAWRVFDAQYWGVPQRRRRIHLIADFRGERATKVLFEREGLRGYFTESIPQRKRTSTDSENCVGADDCGGNCLNPWDVQSRRIFTLDGPWPALYGGEGGGHGYVIYDARGNGSGAMCPTLTGDHENRITDYTSVLVKPVEIDRAYFNQGKNAQYDPQLYDDGSNPTIVARGPSAVAYAMQAFGKYTESDTASAMKARDYKDATDLVVFESRPQDSRINTLDGVSPSVTVKWAKGTADTPIVMNKNIRFIVRRLTPTECARLQGFADEWGHPVQKTDFTDEEYRFWLEVRNTHARINGKTVKEYTKEQMLKWYNGLHTDSAEYKMWGNGIALPPALHVMQGIREVLEGA